jgi:hypothetical protein
MCGTLGKKQGGSWIKTLCEQHLKKDTWYRFHHIMRSVIKELLIICTCLAIGYAISHYFLQHYRPTVNNCDEVQDPTLKSQCQGWQYSKAMI